MVTVVVIFNIVLTSLCWYGTWRIWRLRQALAAAADSLIWAEQQLFDLLQESPSVILQGQQNTAQWHSRYREVQVRIQQVQQLVALLGLGRLVWQYCATNSVSRAAAGKPAPKPTRKPVSKPVIGRAQTSANRNQR